VRAWETFPPGSTWTRDRHANLCRECAAAFSETSATSVPSFPAVGEAAEDLARGRWKRVGPQDCRSRSRGRGRRGGGGGRRLGGDVSAGFFSALALANLARRVSRAARIADARLARGFCGEQVGAAVVEAEDEDSGRWLRIFGSAIKARHEMAPGEEQRSGRTRVCFAASFLAGRRLRLQRGDRSGAFAALQRERQAQRKEEQPKGETAGRNGPG